MAWAVHIFQVGSSAADPRISRKGRTAVTITVELQIIWRSDLHRPGIVAVKGPAVVEPHRTGDRDLRHLIRIESAT